MFAMKLVRFLLCAGVVAGGLGLAAPARAGDSEIADALFQRGRELLQAGEIAAACDQFAQSQKLDPSPGTMLNLASCHDLLGKTATAYREFRAAAELGRAGGRADFEAEAERRAAELESRLSGLRFELREPVEGLEIWIDGRRVEDVGSPVYLDPGQHSVRASADGYEDWTHDLELGDRGDVRPITVPTLRRRSEPEDAAPRGASTHASTALVNGSPSGEPLGGDEAREAQPRSPALGFALVGVGALGLGGSLGLGAWSRSAYDDAREVCPGHEGCDDGALEDWRRAQRRAWGANVAAGAGVAAVVVGTWWVVHARRASRPGSRVSIVVEPHGATATYRGAFGRGERR